MKEPVFPPSAAELFHHPAIHTGILSFVEENPGLTRREIAAGLGKKTDYVASILWRLRK